MPDHHIPTAAELATHLPDDAHVAAIAIVRSEEGSTDEPVVAWSDGESGSAEEPRFFVYSITKTMIATILLALQEVGRVHLDAPLADWYPAIPRASDISLRMVLHHSAGIPDYGGIPDYLADLARDPKNPWTFDHYVSMTAARKSLFEPGSAFSYSNPGFMLLRRIAEEITEMSFAELVTTWIAEPLGLQRTSVATDLADLADLAPAFSTYLSETKEPRDIREYYHPGWVSHGVVLSTATEIARFFTTLFTGGILTHASLEEMREPFDVIDKSGLWVRPQYGLGLMIDNETPEGPIFGHGGNGPGTAAFAAWLPERGYSICALVNGGDALSVARKALS